MQYFSFQWHITEECDQRCKHCYIFSNDNNKKIEQMSFDQMMENLSIIEDFCETFHREPYLFLTGGDPILHVDFWKLMDELNQAVRRTACLNWHPSDHRSDLDESMETMGAVLLESYL